MNPKTEYRIQKTEDSPSISVLHLRLLFVFTVVLFLVIGAVSPVVIGAESLPGPAIPDGFGVNIHFTNEPRDLDLIAEGGFKFIRMDLGWGGIEREKGIYKIKILFYNIFIIDNICSCKQIFLCR